MVNMTQATNHSTHHAWNFFRSKCQRVGFWCRCFWFVLESRLIRSNNQSRATLWVLDTCLIVGLDPSIIRLITASLSSNTYNKASWREDWTFEGTESMSFITSIFLWDLWCLWSSQVSPIDLKHEKHFKEQKQSAPTTREQEARLISIQRPKRWFPILLNCVKLKFVSCTSNLLEQMYDFQEKHNVLPKVISNFQDLPRSQSLETVRICVV